MLKLIGLSLILTASGAVGAYRWAESVLGQYLADGRDTASARAAGLYTVCYRGDSAADARLMDFRDLL